MTLTLTETIETISEYSVGDAVDTTKSILKLPR